MNAAFEITETVEAPITAIAVEALIKPVVVKKTPRERIVLDEDIIPTITVEDFTAAITEESYVSRVREIVSLYEMHHNVYDSHFGPDYMTLDQRRFDCTILRVMRAIVTHQRDDLVRVILEGNVFRPCFFKAFFRDWIENKKIDLILLYAHSHVRLHRSYKASALMTFEQMFALHCDPELLRELFRRDRQAMMCFTALPGHLIFSKHRDLIFFLLDQGFDIETTFPHKGHWLTPLEFTVYHCVTGRKELIHQLIARGANYRHLNRVTRYRSPTLPPNINLATVAFSNRDSDSIIALARYGIRVTLEQIALYEEANGEKETLMAGGWFDLHGYKEVFKYLPKEYNDRVSVRVKSYGRQPIF